jgi:hypothetical protein
MKSKYLKQFGTVLALAGVVGCSSQGLSSRETGMQTYSEIVHPAAPNPVPVAGIRRSDSIAADLSQNALPATGPVHLEFPARVSVVQVGEISPPQSMLAALRSHRELFQSVSSQPGTFDQSREGDPHDRLESMRNLASNLGSRYLLVFGGNIDAGNQVTGLAVFNLTIVGCFIVPSTAVAVSGKSAGSLVDVSTGRVLMNFSADTKGTGLVPTAFAENTQTASVDRAKDALVQNLTTDIINQMTEQRKPPVAMAK